jgi:hypothetical protein
MLIFGGRLLLRFARFQSAGNGAVIGAFYCFTYFGNYMSTDVVPNVLLRRLNFLYEKKWLLAVLEKRNETICALVTI